jgi:hypothetical protein
MGQIALDPNGGPPLVLGPDGAWTPARMAKAKDGKLAFYDGEAWREITLPEKAAPAPDKSIGEHASDAIRALAEGATMGWSQELYSKIDEMRGLGKYEDLLKEKEEQDAGISPAVRIPANVGGAIMSTLATGGLAAPVGLGRATAAVPNAVKFGGLGALEGAITGAGMSPGDRLKGAAIGGTIGGVTGVAAPYVTQGIGTMINRVRHGAGPEANAAADIGRALARDNDTPEAILQRFQQAARERPGVATLSDVGGENVRGLTERIAQTPGAGRTQVVPALTAKQQAQATRITQDLRQLTGTNHTARQAIDLVMEDRRQLSQPLYDTAMQFDAAAVPEIVNEWTNATAQGWGRSVLNSRQLRNNLQTEYGIANVQDAPLMPLIDAWKKTADDLARSAGRGTNQHRIISNMQRRVLDVVDQANPDYAAARNAWSGPTRFLEQIEEGRNILSSNVSSEELRASFQRLTEAEQEAYRIGVVSAIVSKLRNNPARLPDVTRILRSPEMRDKIVAIMPTQQAAQTWQRRLNYEVDVSEIAQRSLGNSATARRLAEMDQAAGLAGDLVLDVLSGGSTGNILLRLMRGGRNMVRDTLRSRADRRTADVLTNPLRAGDLPGILGGINPPPVPQVGNLLNAGVTAGGTQLTMPR